MFGGIEAKKDGVMRKKGADVVENLLSAVCVGKVTENATKFHIVERAPKIESENGFAIAAYSSRLCDIVVELEQDALCRQMRTKAKYRIGKGPPGLQVCGKAIADHSFH